LLVVLFLKEIRFIVRIAVGIVIHLIIVHIVVHITVITVIVHRPVIRKESSRDLVRSVFVLFSLYKG